MDRIGNRINLIICQKSKVQDWIRHIDDNYPNALVYDLTRKNDMDMYIRVATGETDPFEFRVVGIINYDLIFRRPELKRLKHFTLMLDESSLISNEQAKRSKTVLRMHPDAVVLLSGTPTAGKYERLWSQCRLLEWDISKTDFYDR